MKYRKKPIIVEAIQWNGTNELDIQDFMGGITVASNPSKEQFYIDTLEGRMITEKGDWIIKEPHPTKDRTFYPCKPDIFEATYEKVEEK